ncbi:putative LRR receptor-like serine/threonine-protein kinase [Hibiscus syriacus]|uniref:LRR receptor-like serine/threonine-protein kinase n=1 Tax=Hibiscus syriacus TaxID=106335 RepID=A0A6A3CTI9_HIBSY|nr:putative LRR receptor-like serine/threonine-protein kinase [Hibiscus syriacus]
MLLKASGLGLSGLMPDTTIGKQTQLQSLDLSNNKITALPSDLWSLGSHRRLNLSLIRFLAISSLASLQVLKLAGNGFEGSIPTGILNCQSLVSLDLSLNRLNGSLPDGFGAAFPKLKTLNLGRNEVYGHASDFAEMKSLTSLNISGNLFKGSITGVFQGQLEVIDLSKNQLQCHISQLKTLGILTLHTIEFARHKFPKTATLMDLEYLNLSKATLIGHISALSLIDSSPSDRRRCASSPLIEPNSHLDQTSTIIDPASASFRQGQRFKVATKPKTVSPIFWRFQPPHSPVSLTAFTSLLPVIARTKPSPWVDPLSPFVVAGVGKDLGVIGRPIGHPSPPHVSSHAVRLEYGGIALIKLVNPYGPKVILGILEYEDATLIQLVNPYRPNDTIGWLAGLLFPAFGCRRKSRTWVVKQPSYKEEQNISGPFSFQTDSTTWVANVKQATSVPVVIFEKPLRKVWPCFRGFLPGGIHVAVKVLVHGSTLTDQEAAIELEYLGRIKHPNLVPLTGYCLAGDQRIAIYDYMENGNLQNLLHDLPLGVQATEVWSTDTWEEDNNGIQNVGSGGLLTTWAFRHKIALGTARALAFLHHGCSPSIIHRDVKASSEKKPIRDDYPKEQEANLVSWFRRLMRMNQGSKAIDPKIHVTGLDHQMEEALKIGYLCTADLPTKRPSMQQIVGLLNDIEPRAPQ